MASDSLLNRFFRWLVTSPVIILGLMLVALGASANAGRTLYREAFVRTTSTFSCDRARNVCQLTESENGQHYWKPPRVYTLDAIDHAEIEITPASTIPRRNRFDFYFYDRRELVLYVKTQDSALPLSEETSHDLSSRQLQSAANQITSYARDAISHPNEPTFSTSWVIYPTWGSVFDSLVELGFCLILSFLCFERFRNS